MFPDPFHIGPLRIAPYGIMIALGLLAAIVLGGRENQRIKLMAPELFEKVALWTVIWGLFMSRMFYVLTDLERFLQEPFWKIFAIWEGGLVFYGGPIGSVLYLVWHFVIRRHDPDGEANEVSYREGWQRLLRFFDLGAPFLALAHGFGRLGCICAGCCYGAPHEGALALHYPEGSPAYIVGEMGRYPVPLVESAFEFGLFAWLMRLRLRKSFHGQVMLNYVIFYPIARFILEMFRGDAIRGYVFRLETPGLNEALGLDPATSVMMTTSQFISIFVILAAIGLIFVGKRASAQGPIETINYEEPEEDEDEDDEDDEDEDEASDDGEAEASEADADESDDADEGEADESDDADESEADEGDDADESDDAEGEADESDDADKSDADDDKKD